MIIALLRALHSSYVGHFVESPLPAVRQWGTALMVERYYLPSYVRGASDYGKNLTSSSRPVCLWIIFTTITTTAYIVWASTMKGGRPEAVELIVKCMDWIGIHQDQQHLNTGAMRPNRSTTPAVTCQSPKLLARWT